MHPNNTIPTIITKTDYFGKLNEMLIKYKDKGDVLIMGDLNTRTGNEDGLHENLAKQLSHLLPDIEATTSETGNRCSCDVKVNTSGRKLLTICSSHSLKLQMARHLETGLKILHVSTIGGQVLWTT